MNRLLATMGCDIRLQFRNGFYYAVAFVVAGWAVLVRYLPAIDWGPPMPALILGNLIMTTFYFIGGLVLLEKGEGTLEAQIVTPLAHAEYLASKVITLSVLGLAENLLIVMLFVKFGFGALPLIFGTLLAGAIFCFVGFVAVSRYDSINEYLLPSVLYMVGASIPYVWYFGLWDSWLLYLHPLQPPMMMMKAAFVPIAPWQWAYGLVGSLIWVYPMYRWSRRAFRRFVVGRERDY